MNFCNPCGEAKAYLASKGVNMMIEEDYENENCIEESAWAVDMFYGMDDYDGYSFTEPYEK